MTVYAFILDRWHVMHYLPPIMRLVVQLWNYPSQSPISLLAELNKANTREVVKQRLRARGETELLLEPLHLVSCCDVYVAAPQSIAADVISTFGLYRYKYGESQSADVYLDRHFINTGGPNQPMIRQSIMNEAVLIAGRQPSLDEVPSTFIFKLDVNPAALEFVLNSILFPEGRVPESQITHLKHALPRSSLAPILVTLQAASCVVAISVRLARNMGVSPMEAIGAYYGVHILMNQLVRWSVDLPSNQFRPLIVYLDAHLWQETILPALQTIGTNHAPGAAPSASPLIRKLVLTLQAMLVCIMLAFSIHWFLSVGLFCATVGLLFVLAISIGCPNLFTFKLEAILPAAFATDVLVHIALALAIICSAKYWWNTGFHLKTLPQFGF
ncbi:hypothetical protein GOP47_0002927 [Adiantum capillus-veneris]|uniref:Uncharacterized protein n=1 Tax=Adiantum capillus-veneris TaxID=13818 RepID=A0A9D4ZPL8_ADICA|nr:hypothetical protein GOP47_0002927 [Adiantum capillus-veneris]